MTLQSREKKKITENIYVLHSALPCASCSTLRLSLILIIRVLCRRNGISNARHSKNARLRMSTVCEKFVIRLLSLNLCSLRWREETKISWKCRAQTALRSWCWYVYWFNWVSRLFKNLRELQTSLWFNNYIVQSVLRTDNENEKSAVLTSCAGMTCHERREHFLSQVATSSQF